MISPKRKISRRTLLSGPWIGAAAVQIPGPRATAPRPNVLWILAEDMSPQLACYGEPLVQTPSLDRLATEGVRFTRAYTPAPVCSASRSALITGCYQTSIGAHNHRTLNKKPLPQGVRLVTDYFRDAGYFTVLSAPAPGSRKAGEGTGSAGSGKTDFNFLAPKPFDGRDWNERPKDSPFFAQLTIQESHKGIGWPLGRLRTSRIDQSKLKLPPYYPDHPVARDEYANYLEAIQLVDRYVGEVMLRLDRESLTENTLVFFLGDNGSCLFRGKQFLYEGGIHVPFIARWPGRLPPGGLRSDLVNGIDLAPTSLAAAGIDIPKTMQGINLLAPNLAPRQYLYTARDRCDIATDRIRSVMDQRYKYIRNFLPGIPYMQRNPYKEKEYPTWNLVKQLKGEGRLTPVQALFVAESKPVEELYDLQSDADEVRNLAAEPDHRERLLSMRQLLNRWIEETGDQGWMMEDPVPVWEQYFQNR